MKYIGMLAAMLFVSICAQGITDIESVQRDIPCGAFYAYKQDIKEVIFADARGTLTITGNINITGEEVKAMIANRIAAGNSNNTAGAIREILDRKKGYGPVLEVRAVPCGNPGLLAGDVIAIRFNGSAYEVIKWDGRFWEIIASWELNAAPTDIIPHNATMPSVLIDCVPYQNGQEVSNGKARIALWIPN